MKSVATGTRLGVLPSTLSLVERLTSLVDSLTQGRSVEVQILCGALTINGE